MKIVIVKKTGVLGELDWKKNLDLKNLYKKAGFRKDKDFSKKNTWKVTANEYVSVYAKDTGRANTENKYELPPPIDSDLYFGNLVIIKHSEKTPCIENCEDLCCEDWKKIYEKLMGGFEDLNDEEEKSEEEYVAPEDLTKHGYKKDGFVVEDDNIDFHSGEESEEEEEEYFPSNNEEDTDDSLEETDEEEEPINNNEEKKDNDDDQDEDDQDEDETDTSSAPPSLESCSDNELCEEDYQY